MTRWGTRHTDSVKARSDFVVYCEYGLSLYSHPGQGAPGAADPGSICRLSVTTTLRTHPSIGRWIPDRLPTVVGIRLG